MSAADRQDAGPTIAQTIMTQARAEGEWEGLLRGWRRLLKLVLEARFGDIPPEIDVAIASADIGALERWLTYALMAKSIEETGITADLAR